MAFSVPAMPLPVNVWRQGAALTDPPAVTTVGNLAWGRRVAAPASGGTSGLGVVFTAETLLLPPLVDVRDGSCPSGPDVVEVPAGSGRFYDVATVDDIGKGFANEHRAAVLTKHGPWPQPIP